LIFDGTVAEWPWQGKKRIDTFLTLTTRHHSRPLFVLFDSCWDPDPRLGRQPAPRPGVMLSGWVQSPGASTLKDPSQYPRLEAYVKGVIGAFAHDKRVLAWDLWNEPWNLKGWELKLREPPNARKLVQALLPQVFRWARPANPTQPLTSGVWEGGWSGWESLSAISKIQVSESDILSFHTYDSPTEGSDRYSSTSPMVRSRRS
jgi:hypothetical protein